MTFDPRVLAILLAFTSGLMLLIMLLVHRAFRHCRGPGWWTLANLSLALGYVCNMLHDVPTVHAATVIANNLLFLLALFCLHIGLRVFFGRTPRLAAHGLWLGLATGVAAFFTLAVPDESVRSVVFALQLVVISLWIVRTLHRAKDAGMNASRRALGGLYALHGAFWLLRALPPLLGQSAAQYRASSLTTAMYFVQLAVGVLTTFGVIVLLNERLNRDNRQERETFEKAFNASPDAVLVTRLEDGLCRRINSGFTRLLGYTQEDVRGRTTRDLGLWVNLDERETMLAALRGTGRCEELESEFVRKDGTHIHALFHASLITLEGELSVISYARDITARRQAEDRVRQLIDRLESEKGDARRDALTDGLTGLANRRHFDETLQMELTRLREGKGSLSLILADVDFFKLYNDQYGHLSGDRALQLIACAMQGVVRRVPDLVARYGGEEFAVILPETDPQGAIRAAESIRMDVEAMRIPHAGSGIAPHVTISLGVVTLYAEDRQRMADVVARVDHALYHAKQGGRNRVGIDRMDAANPNRGAVSAPPGARDESDVES